ncbi:MAG TPA: glycosyltransferase family 4 protein [Candidatus Sulfotelmatobacter sp.]|nr:glycosyltransferase family 4 protein [Candidatus Sulfotelmatobacter sp.]
MNRKVLIVVENSTYPPDPRVRNEALALVDNGYDVTVLCPRSSPWPAAHELIDGVRVYRHPEIEYGGGRFGYLLEYSAALFWEFFYSWWIYLKHGFQVIQGCNPPDTIFLVALPFKLLGVRYIFDHHDANPELYESKYNKRGFLYRVLVALEKLTYRFSDVVIATNESYRDLAMSRGGIAKEDVFIVRNGPKDGFKAVNPNAARKQGKSYLVGYVGNMDIQDGLDILLDVALQVKQRGRSDVHFACVGGGPQLATLRDMVKEKRLEDTVTFTGRISDEEMLEVLSTADVCVNPDKPCEMNDISTMIKIMEYMALGKPIVQFNSKEGRFSAGDASLYSNTENHVDDFANKILWLLDHPEEREKMGEFGRNRVEKELAWKHSVPNLLAAYDRAFYKRTQ